MIDRLNNEHSDEADRHSILAEVAKKFYAKHSGDMEQADGITVNELSVRFPFYGAAKSTAFILSGKNALADCQYKNKYVDLIVERCKNAIQDSTFESTQVLMSQVVILEAIISQQSMLLGIVDSIEERDNCIDSILRAQGELRKMMLAIDQIRNPKKPTQFIKNYVHQQLNQLKTELEAPNDPPIAIAASERPEAIFENPPVEAVEIIDRPKDTRREKPRQSKRLQE